MIWFLSFLFSAVVIQAAEIKPVTSTTSKVMSESVALKYIKNKSILLKLSLRSCQDLRIYASRVKKQKDSIYWTATVSADAKLSHTSCQPDDPYLSQYLLLYCKKSKTLHEVHSYFPVSEKLPDFSQPMKTCGSFVRI